jgi:tetratricopeptide (TPR) repeat protein
LQNYARAIEDLGQAIELNTEDSAAYNNRRLAYARLQDYARAIEDCRRVIELKSKFAPALFNTARVYALMGKTGEAYKWLEKAIGLDKKYRRIAWSDKDFVGIREGGASKSGHLTKRFTFHAPRFSA